MWEYSDKVKEHFKNPKNVGSIENADAIGEAGALSCGDKLKLYLRSSVGEVHIINPDGVYQDEVENKSDNTGKGEAVKYHEVGFFDAGVSGMVGGMEQTNHIK